MKEKRIGYSTNSNGDNSKPKRVGYGTYTEEEAKKETFNTLMQQAVADTRKNYDLQANGVRGIPVNDPTIQKIKNPSQNQNFNPINMRIARNNAQKVLDEIKQRHIKGEKITINDVEEEIRARQILNLTKDLNEFDVPYKNPENSSQVYLNRQAIQSELDTNLYTGILNSDRFGIYYNKGINATEDDIKDKGVFNKIKNNEDVYAFMEEGEKQLYYYFVGKGDAEELRKYIQYIKPILENRYVEAKAKDMNFIENIDAAVTQGVTSVFMDMARAGVNTRFAKGKMNYDFLENSLEPTYYEKLFTEVQKNSKNRSALENYVINAVNSIANQVPKLAIAASGGYGAYVVTMATQSIGSSTTDAINNGYDVIRGVMHGLVDTATELSIEKLLGGIVTKISGGSTNPLLKKALNAVDNVFSNKKIANLFAKGVSLAFSSNAEGLEEFIQAYLSPVVRNVVYGENNKITNETFYEAVESYLIGGICGFAVDVTYTGTSNKLAQTRLEMLGEDLNKYVGAESLLKFAENVENNSETYYEVKGKFETGKEIDNMLLATLYNESAKAFENPSAEIVKAVSSKDINNLIKLAEKYAENKHKTAGNVKTDAANINAQTTATPVNANVDEIAVSLENGGEYKGYKITDTYFSSITSSTRFELTKPNGEKLEGWSDWDSKGDAKELYNDAAIMIAEDLAQPTVDTQNSTLQAGETKDTSTVTPDTSTASVDSSTDISTDGKYRVKVKKASGNVTAFGGIDTENGKHLDKAQQDEIKGIGNKLGREVVFEDFHKLEKFKNKKKVPDGYIDKDGKVHINFYAKKPVQFLLKHEITHYLKREIDKFKYADFQNLVFGSEAFKTWMQSKGFASLTELKQDVYNRYSEVKNFNEQDAFEEILADFVGDYLFGGENAVSQKLIDALAPKQKKTFMEIIKDIIAHIKQKFSGNEKIQGEIAKLEDRFVELYNEAMGIKNIIVDDSGEISYSYTDEFATNVMQWSKSAARKPGDLKIFNSLRNGFVLLEATEDGYVELARGDYKEVKKIEQSYKEPTDTVYVHTALYENDQIGSVANNSAFEDKGKHGQGGKQPKSKGLQTDFARNNENLRTSDKGKSINFINQASSKDGVFFDAHKQKQLDIIKETNPMWDDYHTGIRKVSDIHTWDEVLEMDDEIEGQFVWGDFSRADAEQALKDGTITVYSSYPIKNGVFVSTSHIQAQEYAGGKNGKVYSKTVPLNDVAWINGDEGQYAEVGEEDIDYSIPADSEGNRLSKEQSEFFKDSKVRDENGNLKVMYHGSPNAGFTVFKSGTYFTEHKWYADLYQGQGASSLGYKKTANNPDTYAVYLDIKKPFDTRNKTERDIFYNEYYQQWGTGTDLMESGLPDWMDGQDLQEFLEENDYDYDGLILDEGGVGGYGEEVTSRGLSYVVFNPEQVKNVDNKKPTTDPDIRYSIPATSNPEELLEAYENGDISRQEYLDTIKKKKTLNPKEITDLTKEDANTTPKLKKKEGVSTGNKTSKFYGSVLASSIFDPKFKAEVATDTFVEKYKSVTNKETLRKAAKELDEGGQSYVDKWKDKKPEHASLIDTAVGFILMDRYQRIGDYESAAKATEKVREFGTAGGQQVQIFSIIGRLTPSSMAAYAQLQLDKAFEIFKQTKTKEWLEKNKDKYKLTDDEIEFIRLHTLQAALFEEGTRQRAVFLGEIMALLQSKLPPEKGDSIRAWQRIAMLLNLRTIQRNVVGNAGMVPIYIASDLFGTAIDKVAAKKTGTRTKGVWMPSSIKGMGKGFYESYDDFKRGIRTRMEDLNRFDVSISKGKNFNENSDGLFGKEILKNQLNAVAKVLNKIDNFTSFCLEAGDRPFFEMWFMNSLNKQMKLNNVDIPTAQMMETAKQEALERTWQDDNVYTRAVGKIKSGLNVIHLPKTNYGLGDVVIKFVKTPTNIAKAIYDFSPAGFASAAGNIRKLNNAIKTDNFTPELQRAVVRSLSNAITGTVIYTLIAVGASLGLVKLTGDDDEDKDVSNYEKYIMGTPPYSIEFFGTSITYDWMQPFGSILAMVAEYNGIVEENPDMGAGSKIWEVVKAGGSTLAKQSFVKSMEELFSGDDIAEGVANVMLADPSAFIPQLSSQVASFFDEYRRTTYDSNSAFQTAINKVIAKIPGLRENLPKQVNSLGEDVKNTQYLDVWDAFMSPWNTYPKSSKDVVKDIYKLYKDSGDNSVMPRMAPNYIEKSGVRINFTTEEKNNFQRAMGDRSVQMLTILFGSKEYEKLKDEQKVAIVKKIYDYSYARAKSELKYDFKTLTAFMGKNKNGDPILTKEKYDRMSEENIRKMVEDIFLSNAEVKRLDDYEKLVNYWIDQAKK